MSLSLLMRRGLFKGSTVCLVYPKSTEEVSLIVELAGKSRVSLTAVGGNTGLCGAATPPAGGATALCSLKKMNQVLNVDTTARTITVEAGISVKETALAAEKSDLLFPLRFGAESSAQIGGAIATNAGGYSTLRYGNMRDLLLGVEAVMADGRIINQLKGLHKDNTGYHLASLLCGSEGTLGIITKAVLKLFPAPLFSQTALLSIENPALAVEVLELARQKSDGRLDAFEWMSAASLEISVGVEGVVNPFSIKNNSEAGQSRHDLVLMELSSHSEDMENLLQEILNESIDNGLVQNAIVADSKNKAEAFWRLRESIPQGEKLAGGSIKHDISVPIRAISDFLERAGKMFPPKEIQICAYGHLGDGNIHYNLIPAGDASLDSIPAESCTHKIFDLIDELGGSFSAEHGIGQLRIEELKNAEIQAHSRQ